jgi:hypothetical protein
VLEAASEACRPYGVVAEVQENTFQESASGSSALTQLDTRAYADLIDGGAAFEKVCQTAISNSATSLTMTSGELFKVSRRDEADVLATKLSFNDGITCESTIEEGYGSVPSAAQERLRPRKPTLRTPLWSAHAITERGGGEIAWPGGGRHL